MYLFLSICEPGYSRTGVYYSYLSQENENFEFITLAPGQIFKELRAIKESYNSKPLSVIVASPSQILALPVYLVLKRRPTLDAGWSLFEATITSKKRMGTFYQKAIKNYLIDFIASLVSRNIVLESNLQLEWYRKTFLARRRKLHVVYTGVDELGIRNSRSNLEKPVKSQAKRRFQVIFRGKDNLEAGMGILAECTSILADEDIEFLIFSPGIDEKHKFASNTSIYSSYFDDIGELVDYLKAGDLILGQLSAHPRTKRTIPHKAFEAAYLSQPYLTARNPGVLEIFQEDAEIACCNPDSAMDLARAIVEIKNSEGKRSRLINGIQSKYSQDLRQSKLSNDFYRIIQNP